MAQIIQIGSMWYSDFRQNGKRIRRALSKFKPEATRILKEMLEVRRAQKHGEIARDMAWNHFRDTYISESKIDKQGSTYYHDCRAFTVIESITHLTKINQMTPERLARVRVALIESKKFPDSTISRSIRGMVTAMKWAEDRKYIGMQNWRIVSKKNKEPEGRLDFYEQGAYLELLSKLDGDWFTSALLMGRAGLRRGELLHLEWSDIQFDHSRIVFRSKPQFNWHIKGDSKGKKVRMIPMLTSDLRQHLVAIRRPQGFVLSDKVSRREDVYGKNLSEALKATGVRTHLGKLGFPHILRHTFGSHLAQIGTPQKMIQEWMGHSSPRMTDKYSHLCPPDAISTREIGERLCSTIDPSKTAFGDSTVVSSTLGPSFDDGVLSSEIRDNSH